MNNRHIQTVWPSLFRKVDALADIRREKLATSDGDFLYLNFLDSDSPANKPQSTPTVIILHGLTGSAESNYVISIQRAFNNRGWHSVAMNFRGCGSEPNLKAHSYHSGETSDLQRVYTHIRETRPLSPIAVIGYSLGGNVLLKWLGQTRPSPAIFACVAISVPFQLDICADTLDKGGSIVYRNHMITNLKKSFELKKQFFMDTGNHEENKRLQALPDVTPMKSFWHFDDRITAPLFGFDSVHSYYREASSRQYIKSIKTPTLIIQALDDPFITPLALPTEQQLSPFTQLELSSQGGHVGFIGGETVRESAYWLDQRIPAFIQARIEDSISL